MATITYGQPALIGSLIKGQSADGAQKQGEHYTGTGVVLTYSGATPDASLNLSMEISGPGADGITTPVAIQGTAGATGSGELCFNIKGTPAAAGGIIFTITGTGIETPITLHDSVSENSEINPGQPSEPDHMANLFDPAQLKVGIFNPATGAYFQYKANSKCIEIDVTPSTTYYLKYADRGCHFAQVLCVDSAGVSTIYGNFGIITTYADTVKLKISFSEDSILNISDPGIDYSAISLSAEPSTDLLPLPTGLLLSGFYQLSANTLAAANGTMKSFAFSCEPGHTYKIQQAGTDVQVHFMIQYDKYGLCKTSKSPATSVVASDETVIMAVVTKTDEVSDYSALRIVDATAAVQLTYGAPVFTGTLKAGIGIAGTAITLPYSGATPGNVYDLSLAVTGAGAPGITTPLRAEGSFGAASGSIRFNLSGTPSAGGAVSLAITGTGISSPIVLQQTVAPADVIPSLGYGTPQLIGTLQAGVSLYGVSVLLPYTNATVGADYDLSLAVTGAAASGITTPVRAQGIFTEAAGSLSFNLLGSPTAAGNVIFSITGTGIDSAITMTKAVQPAGFTETYHYAKVPCKPSTAYRIYYGGAPAASSVISFFNAESFLGQNSGADTFTTPYDCNMVGITIPDSVYPQQSLISITESSSAGGDDEAIAQALQEIVSIKETILSMQDDIESLQSSNPGTVPSGKPHYDLNLCLFGDSITAPGMTKWLAPFLAGVSFRRVDNFAVAGANWRCGADTAYDLSGAQNGNNKIWNQFNRMHDRVMQGEIPAPDVAMILAGINDRYFYPAGAGEIDTVFDYSVDYSAVPVTDPLCQTIAGAVRFTCQAIMNAYPDVRIVIATPLPVGGTTVADIQAGNIISRGIAGVIARSAARMGIPVIDQNAESGIAPYREVGGQYYYFSDGIHLSDKGGLVVGKYLSKKITQIL